MLLSFRFANHRSFRDEQQLNLLPVYESGAPDSKGPLEAVPVVGIFGANASGKSNVISAFEYLSNMVGLSDRQSEPGLGPHRQAFRLDPEIAAQPSSYVVDLALGGVRHTYGFTLDDHQILEEWLYSYPRRRKRIVFERTGQKFNWGEESGRSTIRRVGDIVAPTALFLSTSARFSTAEPAEARDEASESLHTVFSCLWQTMYHTRTIQDQDPRLASYYSMLLTDHSRRAAILNLLRAADIGLQDILVKPPDDKYMQATNAGITFQYGAPFPGEVKFSHYGAAGNVLFEIADESTGTLRLLELAAWATAVLDAGGLMLADEIDASLHPLLTANLVGLFRSPAVNKRRAQLVFTTHDATLLGSLDGEDVLERDQVWFTSKRDDGSSELFPLAEFQPRRQGENRQKRYLNGSYGAIPDLSMSLFEQAVTSRADTRAE